MDQEQRSAIRVPFVPVPAEVRGCSSFRPRLVPGTAPRRGGWCVTPLHFGAVPYGPMAACRALTGNPPADLHRTQRISPQRRVGVLPDVRHYAAALHRVTWS